MSKSNKDRTGKVEYRNDGIMLENENTFFLTQYSNISSFHFSKHFFYLDFEL
jgi:hypothetical protein